MSGSSPIFDDALILRVWEWSETSQTISAFTREHGVIRGLAKGSRRPKAAYSGGIEVLTRGQIGFIAKPSTELALVTEWSLEEIFPVLRRNLRSHYAALYAADLVHHLFQIRDPHPGVFDDLCGFLRGLSNDAAVMPLLVQLQWGLLAHSGLTPVMQPGTGPSAFFPQRGELGPLGEGASTDRGPVWRVREATREYLMIAAGLVSGNVLTPSDPAVAERGARLLASYLRFELDEQLPTLGMVFPDLVSARTGGITGEENP